MRELEIKLNQMALEKLRIVSNFLRLNSELEKTLDSYRFNLSKTKSIIGISTTSAAVIDYREMEPTVRIDVDDEGRFAVMELMLAADCKDSEATIRKRADPKKQLKIKEEREEKHKRLPAFRPFGVLEPTSAKAARNDIAHAIQLVCDIASVKNELLYVVKQYDALKTELNCACLLEKIETSYQVSA